MNLIGQPLDRTDGLLKVTGEARYAAEFPEARLAHAVLVTSTIAQRHHRLDRCEPLAVTARRAARDDISERAASAERRQAHVGAAGRTPPVAAAGQPGSLQQRAGRRGGRRHARTRHRRRAPVAHRVSEQRRDRGLRASQAERARAGQDRKAARPTRNAAASTTACKAARCAWTRSTPRRSNITTRWSRTPRWRAGTVRNSRSTIRRKASAARRRRSRRRSACRPATCA